MQFYRWIRSPPLSHSQKDSSRLSGGNQTCLRTITRKRGARGGGGGGGRGKEEPE